jgi:hypothetical protein
MNAPVVVTPAVRDAVAKIEQAVSWSSIETQFTALNDWLRSQQTPSLVPLLPFLFRIDGKPFTLKGREPFELLFRTRMPRKLIGKTGRQEGKSRSLMAQGLTMAAVRENFRTLFICPLFESVRRLSNLVCQPLIESSPFRQFFKEKGVVQNVFERSLPNKSALFFGFAFLTADRLRGLTAEKTVIDEVQDFDIRHLPVITEVMSATDWRIQQFFGTPKTMDNTMEQLWQQSSMGEWVIKCHHGGCGEYNYPCLDMDLDDMIGPMRDDIDENNVGLVCAHCSTTKAPRPLRPMDPKFSALVHRNPVVANDFLGIHIPQPILPIHCGKKDKWGELLLKRAGRGGYTPAKFWNEVCGESFDSASKLVTISDLLQAHYPDRANDVPTARQLVESGRYLAVAMGVDWGGGGEDGTSKTGVAVSGLTRAEGKIEVIWGGKFDLAFDRFKEARVLLNIVRATGAEFIAHDYNGTGQTTEQILVQHGYPVRQIVPILYTGPRMQRQMVEKKEPEPGMRRPYYSMDKTRSLLHMCMALKLGWLRTFAYDHTPGRQLGLLHDFLALTENKVENDRGPDTLLIQRAPAYSDDFAHAVNLSATMLWHLFKAWPNLADPRLDDPQILDSLSWVEPLDVDDLDRIPKDTALKQVED